MKHSVDAQTAPDPVLADFELPLNGWFFPLGFPLELKTNSPKVIEAAEESWGGFSPQFDEKPVTLSLGVSLAEDDALPGVPVYRARNHLISLISDPENFIVCDGNAGFAFGWMTQATVSCGRFFRQCFLEGAAYTVLDSLFLAPVHGALVSRDGCGVLLCGDTFAGKSTLAYACARAGWTFTSDDCTSLLRNRTDRFAIGNPHAMRFREDAPDLFPELERWVPAARLNGKMGIEAPTGLLPGVSIAFGCAIRHVVFLDRKSPGDPRLQPLASEEALPWFERFSCFGDPAVRESQRNVYKRLSGAKTWRLHYQDLDAAVSRLDRLARSGI
jgi:hypothetical protein